MSNLLRIIKINILSMVALPFLVCSTVFKMTAKAFGKISTILIMSIITGVIFLVYLFTANPGDILKNIMDIANMRITIFVCVVVGILIFVLKRVFSFGYLVVSHIYHGIINVFEKLYEWCYLAFMGIESEARREFELLTLSKGALLMGVFCIFYSILQVVNLLLTAFIRVSLLIFIVGSLGFIWYSYHYLSDLIFTNYNLTLPEYLKSLDTFSCIVSVLLYAVIIISVFVVFISLAAEWREWSRDLRMDDEDYEQYIEKLEDDEEYMVQASFEDDEINEYIDIVSEHLGNAGAFMDEAMESAGLDNNPLLESACSEYLRLLSETSDFISSDEGEFSDVDKVRLAMYTKQLDKHRDSIYRLMEKQNELIDNPAKKSLFFSGCTSRAQLDKRYKGLCRTYHPDGESGDEDTFIAMCKEYEELKEKF